MGEWEALGGGTGRLAHKGTESAGRRLWAKGFAWPARSGTLGQAHPGLRPRRGLTAGGRIAQGAQSSGPPWRGSKSGGRGRRREDLGFPARKCQSRGKRGSPPRRPLSRLIERLHGEEGRQRRVSSVAETKAAPGRSWEAPPEERKWGVDAEAQGGAFRELGRGRLSRPWGPAPASSLGEEGATGVGPRQSSGPS